MTTRLLARYDGKTLVPVGSVDLSPGELVELEIRPHRTLRRGSRELLLKAFHQPPQVTADDVAEMERMIEESQAPSRDEGIFDERE